LTRASSRAFVALLAALASACHGRGRGGAAVGISQVAPILPGAFKYDSLDDRPVDAQSLRGKITVLAFITTYDLGSQAQANFLTAMAKHDEKEVNYVLVALQEPKDRELVEVYRSNLGITFPVALADAETITGGGPLGDVHKIPTVVVLDRTGRIMWKKIGIATSGEIRAGMLEK
jgi:hypothetical protein